MWQCLRFSGCCQSSDDEREVADGMEGETELGQISPYGHQSQTPVPHWLPRSSTTSQISTFNALDSIGDEIARGLAQILDELARSHELEPLDEDDVRRWENEKEPFIERLRNHWPASVDMLNDVSFDAKRRGNERLILIGCNPESSVDIQGQIKRALKRSKAQHFIRKRMRFDSIDVTSNFMGHDAAPGQNMAQLDDGPEKFSHGLPPRISPNNPFMLLRQGLPSLPSYPASQTYIGKSTPSLSAYAKAEFTSFSALGGELRISGSDRSQSLTTFGGVILVNGKPYGLTTGCGISRLASKSPTSPKISEAAPANPEPLDVEVEELQDSVFPTQQFLSGPVVAHRYPRARPAKYEATSGSQAIFSSEVADWALIELPGDKILPNAIVTWGVLERDLLVEKTVSATDLAELMADEGRRVSCLTYARSSRPIPIPGSIAAGTSTIILDGATWPVLRVDMEQPLEYGDSGSWVVVGNGVCGMIIAGNRWDPDLQGSKGKHFEGNQILSAYMIPITDVFDSISRTLSASVTLPTSIDYELYRLKAERRIAGSCHQTGQGPYWRLESLIAQQKLQRERQNGPEDLNLQAELSHVVLHATCRSPSREKFRKFFLEESVDFQYETIHQLLPIGEICPLSKSSRPLFRQWARDNRKSRFRHAHVRARRFLSRRIVNTCLKTEAGENLLGLIIYFWAIDSEVPKKLRISWIAELLSAILRLMRLPVTVIPSAEQIRIFVRRVTAAFRKRGLKHPYFALIGKAGGNVDTIDESRWTAHVSTNEPTADFLLSGQRETIDAIARALMLLYKIRKGDGSQVLVCQGRYVSWVGNYAFKVLGLLLGFRAQGEDLVGSVLPDVVIYIPGERVDDHLCEIIDRETIDSANAWGPGVGEP